MFKYEEISNRIEYLIEQGVMNAGDKLMSVRSLSKEQNVSLATAYKAYEQLVIRDIVEARDKSGYYVKGKRHKIDDISVVKPRKKEYQPIETNKIISFAFQKIKIDGIVQLSITAPDLKLLPEAKLNKSMMEALRADQNSCLNYEQMEGNFELRRQILRHTIGMETYLDPEEVVITQGCSEALFLSLMTVTNPGDTVIIERPGYFSLYSTIKNLGLKVIEMDVHPVAGIDLNQLKKYIEQEKISACVFITNFSNPSGYCMSDETKENLVNMLYHADIPLIEDNVYGEIYFEQRRPKSCKSFDKHGMVLSCSSISKTLAPGYRIGWCLPGKYKERFLEIKIMQTVSTSAPVQAAVARFFSSGRYDLHIKKLRKSLQIESLKYIDAIAKYFPEGTKVTKPKGGFVLWIELHPGINSIDLFYEALNKGVSIWPGPIFTASGGFENFIRISFGTPLDQNIKQSLKTLGNLIANSDNSSNNKIINSKRQGSVR